MLSIEEFRALQQQVDRHKRERDQAAGALEELLKRLKAEFGCDDLKQAKKLLAELQAEAERLEAKYKTRLTKFVREWGDTLGSSPDGRRLLERLRRDSGDGEA